MNRIGDRYLDQVRRTGHHDRDDDLDRIAALGVRRVRYPVLWERTAPGALADADWSWPDARLARLRALGIAPIAGLVHHGSGPRDTSLLDPAFPRRLAAYAAAVARRYPWLDAYTPVNEPLTTARFSGLYGLWYPHARDDRSFVRALLHQVHATALAMRAIREVNPRAELVSTEDLGYTRGTPGLAGQAAFENHRRWLSLDLLCGRVDARHPLRPWLLRAGATARELDALAAEPCEPDVLGFNYYVTSERYLDEDLARWPAWSHGGNGWQRYADVHAPLARPLRGAGALLRDAHERFGLPVALTEVHLGGTREEQLRWVVERHRDVLEARRAGVPVRAITAWAAFGSYDWHCLVTRDEGSYEPGLFDVRAPAPRPTALARVWRDLAAGRACGHPAAEGRGWWRREALA